MGLVLGGRGQDAGFPPSLGQGHRYPKSRDSPSWPFEISPRQAAESASALGLAQADTRMSLHSLGECLACWGEGSTARAKLLVWRPQLSSWTTRRHLFTRHPSQSQCLKDLKPCALGAPLCLGRTPRGRGCNSAPTAVGSSPTPAPPGTQQHR